MSDILSANSVKSTVDIVKLRYDSETWNNIICRFEHLIKLKLDKIRLIILIVRLGWFEHLLHMYDKG